MIYAYPLAFLAATATIASVNAMVDSGKATNPVPLENPGNWAQPNDYPQSALYEEREGVTGFRLFITPEGTVLSCVITQLSGHADLDKTTCDVITRRAVFNPATDKKGRAIAGTYSNRVRWQIPVGNSFIRPGQIMEAYPSPPVINDYAVFEIKDTDYPSDALANKTEGMVLLSLKVDVDGKVADCAVSKSSGHRDLDTKSCDLAKERWKFEPAKNIDGESTDGRTKQFVRWSLPGNVTETNSERDYSKFNPFQYPGSVALNIVVDTDGKWEDCQFESSGEGGLFVDLEKMEDIFCKENLSMKNVVPVKDADGNPVKKRVTVKMSIEHEDTE